MTSNFDEIVFSSQTHRSQPDPSLASLEIDCSPLEPDVTKRDRFELLSAYLDGEVTPVEGRLVATWLSEDPETQCLYRRLLALRQAMRTMPVEPTALPVNPQTTPVKGWPHLDPWSRKMSLAIACTIATLLMGSLTNLMGSNSPPRQSGLPMIFFNDRLDSLELALDEPVIEFTTPNLPSAEATSAEGEPQ
jgi:hypothetical protein